MPLILKSFLCSTLLQIARSCGVNREWEFKPILLEMADKDDCIVKGDCKRPFFFKFTVSDALWLEKRSWCINLDFSVSGDCAVPLSMAPPKSFLWSQGGD